LVRPHPQRPKAVLQPLQRFEFEIPEHVRPISPTGFYTDHVAATVLEVRAFQLGTGPLGMPDLRFGGQP